MAQNTFWKKLAEDINAAAALPLVELAGAGRILIENHNGIAKYGTECIVIKMGYGNLEINGNCLEMAQITRHQLVITGRITMLTILRGDKV